MRMVKQYRSLFSRLLCISTILVSFAVPLSQAVGAKMPKVISIASEEYSPYTSEKLKDFGIDAAIVTAAFRLQGIETRYTFLPSARAYTMARSGEVDATLPWAKRDGREKLFHYSDPVIAVDVEHFFFRKDHPLKWDSTHPDMAQLKGLSISAIIGHNYGKTFQEAEQAKIFSTQRVAYLHQGFAMLLANRVDALISKTHVAEPHLAIKFTAKERAQLTSIPVSRAPPSHDYLLISRQGKNGEYFLKAFNQGLRKLRRNGSYQRLMKDLMSGEYAN